jgi:hypothetical protein
MSTVSNSESDQQPKVKQEQCIYKIFLFVMYTIIAIKQLIQVMNPFVSFEDFPFTNSTITSLIAKELVSNTGKNLSHRLS